MTLNQTLACLVLDAMDTHQCSYDFKRSLEASKQSDIDRAANPDKPYIGLVDYAKFYNMSTYQACEQVCEKIDPTLLQPVYLLLASSWNEAQMWAIDQVFDIERPKIDIPEDQREAKAAWDAINEMLKGT